MNTATEPAPRRRPSVAAPHGPRRPWGLRVVAALSFATVLAASVPYLVLGLRTMAETGIGLAGAYVDAPIGARVALYVHIVAATVALVVAPFQLSSRLRRRRRRAHRATGRVYLVSVGVGALAGLGLLPFNSAGFTGVFGFGGLALVWAYAAWRAYRAIRSGDVPSHHAWVLRSVAVTFAAPMLRLWLGLLIGVQVPFAGADVDADTLFANAYQAVPFLCWLPNLLVAEWLVRRRGLPSYRLPPVDASVLASAPPTTPQLA